MNRSGIVLLTLLSFAALLLVVAAWAARRTHNAADFVLANRGLGPWVLAPSVTGNTVNAWMLMTLIGAAFAWGLSAAWIWGGFVIVAALNLFVVAPRLRQLSLAQGHATLMQTLSVDAGDRLQPWVARCSILIFLTFALLQTGGIRHFAAGVL